MVLHKQAFPSVPPLDSLDEFQAGKSSITNNGSRTNQSKELQLTVEVTE